MDKKTFLLFPIYLLLLFAIYSCSDSSTSTTPNTPAGTILYSQDSLSVWLQMSGSGADSFSYSTQNTGGVRLSFTLQSNADSFHAIGRKGLYTNATPVPVYIPEIYSPIDLTDSLNFNFVSGQATYFSMAVRLNVSSAAIPYYIRVKNIRITKL